MLTVCYRNLDKSVVDHATAQRWVAACQIQNSRDLAPIWNSPALLHYIGDSQTEDPAWFDAVINIVRYSSVPNALGAHWTEDGKPTGEVAVQTSRDEGVEPSQVMSHESCELPVDPGACCAVQVGRRFRAQEVCDRVEGSDPDYRINGLLMENFSRPSAFVDGPGPWDFRKLLTSNIVVPTGYQLEVDVGTGEWIQITGARARASKAGAGPSSRRAFRMTQAGFHPAKMRVVPA